MEKKTEEEIPIFIAMWSESEGPTVSHIYPSDSIKDIDTLAINIFMIFENIFGSNSEISFNQLDIVLPLRSYDKIAKIYFSTIHDPETRGGKSPFIIGLLTPPTCKDYELAGFHDILESIAEIVMSKNIPDLAKYHEEIQKQFITIKETNWACLD